MREVSKILVDSFGDGRAENVWKVVPGLGEAVLLKVLVVVQPVLLIVARVLPFCEVAGNVRFLLSLGVFAESALA